MKNNVLITYDVAKTIIRDSKNSADETGGVLVGTLGDPMTIVAAGSPGENSVHRVTQYTSDPIADKNCLEQNRQLHGNRIVVVGWWHKHPSGFDRPSSGDCHQIGQLKAEYKDDKPVLMGIVNQIPRMVRMKTTLRLYSTGSTGNLIEYDWRLINRKSRDLLNAINKAPAKPAIKKTNFWIDKDFQFYLNPVGRERIIQEIEGLRKAGWQVKTSRSKQNQVLILDVFGASGILRFVLASEYPLNPPSVFMTDGRRFIGMDILGQWNSHCHLTDVATEALCIMNCHRCKRRFVVSV
ncbi:MAG: hypothetical protein ACYS17_13775 [Planctomycetota bacterium]|jgi:proteasome lid subunit RPN8/RPN11